jgi:hypothetical protein
MLYCSSATLSVPFQSSAFNVITQVWVGCPFLLCDETKRSKEIKANCHCASVLGLSFLLKNLLYSLLMATCFYFVVVGAEIVSRNRLIIRIFPQSSSLSLQNVFFVSFSQCSAPHHEAA